MKLPTNLVKAFAEIANQNGGKDETNKSLYGTAYKSGDTVAVVLDGSTIRTPATTTMDVNSGDRVVVMEKDHRLVITGNITSPADQAIPLATQARDRAYSAYDLAGTAKLSADGKNMIYRGSTMPTGGVYAEGDVWFDTAHDNKIHRWNGTSWVAFTLGDDALDSISANKITAGSIDASQITVSNLDAGNITSGILDTDRLDVDEIITYGSIVVGGDLTNAINGIDIGSRNILLGTASSKTWTITLNNDGYYVYDCYKTYSPVPSIFAVNDEVTVSFDWSATATSGNFHVECGNVTPYTWGTVVRAVGGRAENSNYVDVSSSKRSGHFEVTFKITSAQTGASTNLQWLRIRADGAGMNSQTITIFNAKAERGNKATDWSPAPEDVQSGINDAATKATNYLTQISGTSGISVHNAGDTSNFVNMDSNGVKIYKGGTKKAEFGTEIILGNTGANSNYVKINDSGCSFIPTRTGNNDQGVDIGNGSMQVRGAVDTSDEYISPFSVFVEDLNGNVLSSLDVNHEFGRIKSKTGSSINLTADQDSYKNMVSLALPSGSWILIANGTFATAQTSGASSTTIRIVDSGGSDVGGAYSRTWHAGGNYIRMNVVGMCVLTSYGGDTITVKMSSSSARNGCTATIYAMKVA